MMSEPTVTIDIDATADVAYIALSSNHIVRTVELSQDILVDLDHTGMVVGVEVLQLGATIPFSKLTEDFHVHSDVIELLRRVQPSVSGFISLTQSSEGTSSVQVTDKRQYA
jgi:uncharacterized protein YuzE